MPPPPERRDENEGTLADPLKFLDQDYQKLLQQSLSRKELFTDELFPPDSSSIGDMSHKKNSADFTQIVWKRPSELVTKPCFTVDGISRFDYKQGRLGNCWFLAAVGALTSQKAIIDQVIPAEQSFSNNYAGIFHFRFWRFGKWIDVVVDDLLPTFGDRLIFVGSKTSNEFWPALLEKAYAKVCGSYADLNSGHKSEALLDFTGGVHLHFRLKHAPVYLWNIMDRAAKSQTLMCCATYSKEICEEETSTGIVSGHAYTVTGVFKVMGEGKSVHLVRVLNPWGRKEWNGDWSDKSSSWKTVSDEDRKKCNEVLENGEFWMAMDDFTKTYENLDICCLCLDFLDISSRNHWILQRSTGKWTETTAGGSFQNTETFWSNPLFRIKIEEDGVNSSQKDAENILVSIIQNQEKRHRKTQKNYRIGFCVFKMQAKSQKAAHPVKVILKRSREVMNFFRLEPGEYLLVPCTKDPGETASFVLSVFSMREPSLRHHAI